MVQLEAFKTSGENCFIEFQKDKGNFVENKKILRLRISNLII